MKKLKTRKSITKRFKVTASGKILRGRSFSSHLRVKKSQKQKRRLKGSVEVTGFYAKKLRKRMGIRKQRPVKIVKEK
ncbi:50S ribosomal protein L35 [Candidatus Woesebacteria bacterium RIFOXYB1_FULL_38_16]|uniref:Large ribosomal subunit protein bL35 n=1 Tax=Candidatus Woesebacteria bacterium RIFOXYB1_FULL_38_16 TaxID=1802538 RepID=A0A1F8CVM7_9BACT|nr:MAG: 50S ribosomal protein L35 [Candidatus Woesebacteria bacterium RIFOXYA1_FULL_38_9]OGM79605.1 MAG: 50S ribosomal protein L35 [Candidatus Woesebacteria bacterium RIFOXYB1_FULL_38_16]